MMQIGYVIKAILLQKACYEFISSKMEKNYASISSLKMNGLIHQGAGEQERQIVITLMLLKTQWLLV